MTIQELEETNLKLEDEKLKEEIKKIKAESDLLHLQHSYYSVKLQILLNENPSMIIQGLKENEI